MTGILIQNGDRPDIVFDNGTLYGGLHCGGTPHAVQDFLHHGLAVEDSKPLDQPHIVEAVIKELSLHIGEVTGDVDGVLLLQRFECGLNPPDLPPSGDFPADKGVQIPESYVLFRNVDGLHILKKIKK